MGGPDGAVTACEVGPRAITACAVIVFAKAPIAGYAKTRLIPALGVEGAARLAERMLGHTVRQAVAAGIGPVEVCCAPDASHPAFGSLAATFRVALTQQGSGDLGARMQRAFARRLAHGSLPATDAVLLIGTDAPALDAAMLRRARDALASHDAAFVPALDGGYALVGLRRPAPGLFDGIAWSTATVMAQTRERIEALGLRCAELDAVADIDEPADLVHAPPAWLAPAAP